APGSVAPSRSTRTSRSSGRRSRGRRKNRPLRLVPWIPPLFRDRAEAGRILAEALAPVELDDPVVVGVARGGVAVGVGVARARRAPLTAVDVERVNAQGLRLGATTAHGPPYMREGHDIPEDAVEPVLDR